MGATSFNGPVRSENGFKVFSKNATTGAETVTMELGTNTSLMTAGTGITTGTGTLIKHSVARVGNLVTTTILIDLTGLNPGGAAGDIMGVNSAANCHLGQITTTVNGTIFGGRMTCLETPAGGDTDIDLYSATESTGTEDAAASGLTETVLLDAGASSAGSVDAINTYPASGEYLYLVAGAGASTFATYTAGKLLIEFYGYDA